MCLTHLRHSEEGPTSFHKVPTNTEPDQSPSTRYLQQRVWHSHGTVRNRETTVRPTLCLESWIHSSCSGHTWCRSGNEQKALSRALLGQYLLLFKKHWKCNYSRSDFFTQMTGSRLKEGLLLHTTSLTQPPRCLWKEHGVYPPTLSFSSWVWWGSWVPGTRGDSCFGTCYTPAAAAGRHSQSSVTPSTPRHPSKHRGSPSQSHSVIREFITQILLNFGFYFLKSFSSISQKLKEKNQEIIFSQKNCQQTVYIDTKSQYRKWGRRQGGSILPRLGLPLQPDAVSHKHGRTCSGDNTSFPAGPPEGAHFLLSKTCGRVHNTLGNTQTVAGREQSTQPRCTEK